VDEAPALEDIGWQGIYTDAFEMFCEDMGFGNSFVSRATNLKQRDIMPADYNA
jgi:hypothetical protein